MRLQNTLAALALGAAVATSAAAADLKPVQSQSIDLGGVAGDAYYTVQQDGFHVVATFAQRQDGATPVRITTVLTPGQAVTFSAPRAAGTQPVSVSFKRQNEQVVVSKAPLIN